MFEGRGIAPRHPTLARFGFLLGPMSFRIRNLGCYSLWRIIKLMLLVLSMNVGISATAHGQASSPTSPSSSSHRSVRCSTPANPGGLYFECVGQPFDYIEETLSKDWGGLRTELSTLGITPTASYTTQLMGNPIGGQSQGFTYAGTLEASINWDLHKLVGIPGLSFNVGGAWSTGRNLSAELYRKQGYGSERVHCTG